MLQNYTGEEISLENIGGLKDTLFVEVNLLKNT